MQGLAEIEQAEERGDPALKTHRARERREKRPSLPDHLAEVEVVLEPEQSVCPCCSGALHRIGEDVSKRLDVVPAQYQVNRDPPAPKYACRACEGTIVQAPAPARLIEGGLPTERLVATVIVDKYADHVPLYRQAQAFARQGITLNRSTLAHWTGYAAGELKPLWEHIRAKLLTAPRLFVDETKGTCAGSGTRQDEERLLLGHCPGPEGLGWRRPRLPWPTPMRLAAEPNMRPPCSRALPGCCRPMDMPPTKPSPRDVTT